MKSELFKLVFNNTVIRSNIFNQFQNKEIYGGRTSRYRWIQLINSPFLLIQYNYFDLFVQHWITVGCNNYHYKQLKLKNNIKIVSVAIQFNRLNFIKCLVEHNHLDLSIYLKDILSISVSRGKKDIVEYLRLLFSSNNGYYTHNYQYLELLDAFESNDLETVKRLSSMVSKSQLNELYEPLYKAISYGHTQLIDWLIDNRSDISNMFIGNRVIGKAIYNRQFHIPDLLLSKGYIEDREYQTSELGINFAQNDIYQWLSTTKLRINFTSTDFDEAAGNSSLEVIKWINDHSNQGCSKNAMYNAFVNLKFDIVKWLHENRTEGTRTIGYINSSAITKDAENLPFEMVKWYHQNRTEVFGSYFMDYAACYSLDVIKFLHYNRSESCSKRAMLNAGMSGQLEIFKFLKDNRTEGVPSDLIYHICSKGQLEMIQYLYETSEPNEYNWSWDLMDLAIKSSNLDLVKWIHQNTTFSSISNEFDIALSRKDFEMVQYLVDNKICSNDLESSILNHLKDPSLFIIEILDWIYGCRTSKYRWIQLINSPFLLIQYNYFDLFVQHWITVGCNNYHYKQLKLKNNIDIVKTAIRFNRTNFIKCLVDNNHLDLSIHSKGILDISVSIGKKDIVEYLKLAFGSDNVYLSPIYPSLELISACVSNDLETVKRLSPTIPNDQFKETYPPLYKAILHGHVQIIHWLINNRTDGDHSYYRMIGMALHNKQHHIPDLLLSKGYIEDREYRLSELGLLSTKDLYQWLSTTKIRINFTSNDFDLAARNSSLDVVKWINDHNNQGCSKNAMYNAFINLKFDTVKWLHENRTEGTHTIDFFNSSAIASDSDKNLAFEMVKWFNQNRTEGFTADFMDCVASFSLDIVKFLHQNRTEGCTSKAILNSGKAGQLEIFKFLKDNRTEDVPIELVSLVCSKGQLEMIQYLYETGEPDEYNWSLNLMDLAIKSSNLDLVKWIHQNTTHGCDINTFKFSLLEKDFEMVSISR
ncbi:hypothetical protein PPL_01714 [Heterostelium album PN500]|uniref:Ankyrin repeat protein n=1 Tax=Heterostelium pallidum (strain ATCC 26659 / Pp 5 / PN500) TaxID=670386 RepID=D3B098_HETP5|nr:hypothetical protein PPL_01714 [Heterostelium album PN500]EFA84722.1 hypothetical protein PPL_01714 [Heterostelium album PN500]|eukprot:XP_020436834.1 hypothetical protein PPL_01714 [Heterostelium album PN500]